MTIYRIRNKINGKSYIGQTIKSVQHRWNVHCSEAKTRKGCLLHAAIRKYGRDAFELSVLCSTGSIEELNAMEISKIAEHKTLVPNGYNIAVGENRPPSHIGKKRSLEFRIRLSVFKTGKKRQTFTDKARSNMASAKRKYFTEEERISAGRENAKRYRLKKRKTMCCSGDPVARDLEKTQAAMTNTLNASYQTMFGEQQALLKPLQAQLQQAVNNPQGFSAQELAALRTSSTDQTAQQFQRAAVAANTMAAAHGGADLGSGVAAGLSAGVAAAGAQAQASSQQQITIANEQEKQQNKWKAIAGLENLGGLENPTPVANAGAGIANSSTDAGSLLLRSTQAGWQNIGGVISGIAGLATAGAGAYKDIMDARG